MRLADYVFTYLASQGVRAVFLVPGGGSMYLVDALGQNPDIQFVPNHHEQASSIAAEAYSRISGRLGCALVTTGPGSTNAITGVAGAWIESVPLLVLSGQVKRADMMGTSGVRQKGPQEISIVPMVSSITKYATTVSDPLEIRYVLEKAVHLATSERQGPVWIDIPLDVQAATIDPQKLRGYKRPTITHPADEAAREVIELINAAERPLIIAGHGIRLAGAAGAFSAVVDRLGVPVVATWNAADLIEASHPLSVGKPGTVALRPPNFAVQNSDLIVAIGARLDNVVTAFNPAKFGREAKKVVIDIDPAELRKLEGDPRLIKAVVADAKEFLDAILRQKDAVVARDRSPWLAKCAEWKRKYPINDGRPFPSSGSISHYHLTQILSDEIAAESLIVTGSSGLAVEIFHTGFKNKSGQRLILTAGLGAMGYGLPAVVGAGIAHGPEPFVAVEGDGSMMLNIQELQTVRTLNLPVRLFVFNNGGYASIRNTQRNYFSGRFVGTGPEARLGMPDFVKVAEAFGIPALKISDASQLREQVRYVLSQRGPLLCDVHVLSNEALWPKSAALPQPDGSIVSMPLEDMSPLLSREELRANMLVPLDPASESVSKELIGDRAPNP